DAERRKRPNPPYNPTPAPRSPHGPAPHPPGLAARRPGPRLRDGSGAFTGQTGRVIGVAVVGCGHSGPKVVRNLAALPGVEVRRLGDLDRARLEPLRRRYPAPRATTDPGDALADPRVDAVAICTPVATHFEIARAALEAGKHVLVEKPLTDSVRG